MKLRISKIFSICFLLLALTINATAQSSHGGWGDIDHEGKPWVNNDSRPNKISKGLSGRHISLWASHGYYYDQEKGYWKWQRPSLFCTTEDLFTQTIVNPYLIPMLENAGANVFSPRERNWQTNEIIVDNDKDSAPNYIELDGGASWVKSPKKGYAFHGGYYVEGENPFQAGSAKFTKATKKKSGSRIIYQPNFPEAGKYAVYVSYQTLEGSVNDAQYIVYHGGQQTQFKVNQQMGGGTWVYLGTFNFDKGCNEFNCVVLTNTSKKKGVVSADAVRFGGGMGNILRGGTTSGMPRCLEGARYYAQWAGAPYAVYSSRGGSNDYADDINVRSMMTNWVAGGSVYVPTVEGLNVPLELSLAVHSDAGYSADLSSLIGSLSICTTNFNDNRLSSGVSRMISKDLAADLLQNLQKDLANEYGRWDVRYLWDRNYSETRLPEVPSAIIETLSHQNFPDMRYGQDPNFRFSLARSIYKTLLRFINAQHDRPFVVAPLAPNNFRVTFVSKDKVRLEWNQQIDAHEPSAVATSYNIYTATGTSDFDNGKNVKSTSCELKIEPNVLYHFKITACNDGGESFPSETLTAYHQPTASKRLLIINNFHRLASPAVVNNDSLQGFDMYKDPGVSYGLTAGWLGEQVNLDRKSLGNGLGVSSNNLAGKFVAGNDFNYTVAHAKAISGDQRYDIASCSSEAVISGKVNLDNYDCIDYINGLEKEDGYSIRRYKTFNSTMQSKIASFLGKGGSLIVSGSYIGSDNQDEHGASFLSSCLKLNYIPSDSLTTSSQINGLGMTFGIYRSLNKYHYAAHAPEILQPMENAICAMQYEDGTSAAVGYRGNDYRCFTMGFPFECIESEVMQKSIMTGILNYVTP